MGLYEASEWFLYVTVITLLGVIAVWIFIPWRKKKDSIKHNIFLFGLPILIILGYFQMNRQLAPSPMDKFFEDKIEGTVQGQLEMMSDKGSYVVLTLKNNTISIPSSTNFLFFSSRVTVYCSSTSSYKIGNILSVSGQISKFKMATNPGQFDELQYNRTRNIDYKINADYILVINTNYSKYYDSVYNLKNKLMDVFYKILNTKDAGIISAMILGEASLLDAEIKELYQQNGISHILAISGLHITIIGLSLYQLLLKIKVPILPATCISIGIIFTYGILTNFSVSTNRSIVMLIVMMMAKLVGRTYDIISALSLSALIILLQTPMQLFNAGFLLSFGAILGIAFIYPIIHELVTIQNKILAPIWNGLVMSFCIQIMTLPIILFFFYEVPVYSLIVNLIILPMASIIVILAVIAGILGLVFTPLGIFIIGGAHYILYFYEFVCKIAVNLPGNTLLIGRPSWYQIIAYYIIILILLVLNYPRKPVRGYSCKSIILLSFLFIIFIKPDNVNFAVTFIDVGQGDGIFMQMPNGKTYLVDGGSTDIRNLGKYRLEPFFKSQGIGVIDYIVVTHTDADHISGLKEIITEGNIRVRYLVLPDIMDKDQPYLELLNLAKSNGIKILYITAGDVIQEGEVTISCLHPDINFTTSSSNGYSTVLSIRYKQYDMLLTGDLESDGEEKLTNAFLQMEEYSDYDVLKVAHHGSKNSTPKELLDIIRPEIAVISYGKDNSYGHPHEELLERLRNSGSNIYATAQSGAVHIETNGSNILITEYCSQ
ncbi:MAG: putative rane protein [Lachnospiraceae bacterium]|jgi:competence protein ComEC|nr:putative rane protein [Lachnospiraceae bacterium]